jgi:Ca2+-binding RTX toxin-like protein
MVEGLETRRLLAANAELIGDVLFVRGEVLARNEIEVSYDQSDPQVVEVKVKSRFEGQDPVVFEAEFNRADFVLLKIRGGVRNDLITLGEDGNPYLGNSRINGLSGNDTIFGGEGSDRIAGGKGNDVIYGRGGNDRLHGELGSDSLYGGDGNDVLFGGVGDDLEDGGAGDDMLGGLLGTNTLIGGGGADKFLIRPGTLSQIADLNEDEGDLVRILGNGGGDRITPPTA